MKEELIIPAIAALVVGLVAGVVSLVVSILAKDQKTSEFRQSWIDGLRNDVSQLVAIYEVVTFTAEIVRERTQSEIEAYVLSQQKDFLELAMLSSRIQLRLNVDEHQELIALLKSAVHPSAVDSDSDVHVNGIVAATQTILKTEWERVKRGEPSFVRLKLISRVSIISIFGAILGAGVSLLVQHFNMLNGIW